MRNKSIFNASNKAKKFWSFYRLRWEWNNFSKTQLKDEIQYTNGILGLNKLGIVFSDTTKDESWGRRGKDFVYGYWTEEDIRLRLASQLFKYSDCQVHGQTHIHGIKNKHKHQGKKGDNHIHYFPDLLLTIFKERERKDYCKEKNIETTSIELKYYSAGWRKRDLKNSIIFDLDKLVAYQKKRLQPKNDAGYFFCIDESGQAENILLDLFRKSDYKKSVLGYGVLVPRYTSLNLLYPRAYEDYGQGNGDDGRKLVYILDYIRGQLQFENMYFEKKSYPSKEKYGFYLRLNEEPRGYLEIARSKYVKGMKRNQYAVILKLYNHHETLVRNYKQYEYSKKEGWAESEKQTGMVLLQTINARYLNSLSNLEWYGKEVANKLKRIYNKANR